MSSGIQGSAILNLEDSTNEISFDSSFGKFGCDEDDIFCEFDTLSVNSFPEIHHLWRNAHNDSVDLKSKKALPTAYDMRADEMESRQISLYEAVSVLKVPENLELEAYNINFFLSTQAPINIANSQILKLDLIRLKTAAKTSGMVNEFIESIGKTMDQSDQHINAYHWDVTFTTADQDKLVQIKSLLCEYSVVFPDVKNMKPDDFSRKMSKIRDKRKKALSA